MKTYTAFGRIFIDGNQSFQRYALKIGYWLREGWEKVGRGVRG
jgi:hypothetical protein